TTTVDARLRRRRLDNAGLLQWLRSPNVANTLLAGQAAGAFTEVQHLLGKERCVRVVVPTPPGRARLDGADMRDLVATAAHHSRIFCPTFQEQFASHIAPPFRPCYGPGGAESGD